MIRRFFRFLKRILLGLLVLLLLLLSPIAYIETMCRGDQTGSGYAAILPPDFRRPEARTLLTYPEWHIVHAYDDYARVISEGDPHDYQFVQGIAGFWTSLCAVSQLSAEHGGFDWQTKQTIYTIGVSFTAELAFKAVYEETLGRISTWVRGEVLSPIDRLSARQAADYARFLQQVPWYQWDFASDKRQISNTNSGSFRDNERRIALGIEYSVKGSYAKLIESAVANIGADALTLRMIVIGISAENLTAYSNINVIGPLGGGLEIETPRYRALTGILIQMAADGANFVEIAGNDDIMLTAIASVDYAPALFSFERQGYGDQRHLILVKVAELGDWLRSANESGLTVEHIHDY